MNFKGAVLAGGKSSRFGEDKALAITAGRTLLQRSVDMLTVCGLESIVISAQGRNYDFVDCPVITDILPEKGPLGGLYTACTYFKDSSLLVLTCDMPHVSQEVLDRLLECHSVAEDVTLFLTEDHLIQPFPGIYESSLLTKIDSQISRNFLSMQELIEQISSKTLLKPSFMSSCFKNINSKEDL